MNSPTGSRKIGRKPKIWDRKRMPMRLKDSPLSNPVRLLRLEVLDSLQHFFTLRTGSNRYLRNPERQSPQHDELFSGVSTNSWFKSQTRRRKVMESASCIQDRFLRSEERRV